MRQPDRQYLQHASRHLPTGSDPILFQPAATLPVAEYVASAAIPVSSFPGSSYAVALDTFTASVNADGSSYFSVVSGGATLAAGFYIAVGYVEFATEQDWSAKTASLALGFSTSGGHEMGAEFFQTTANNDILILSVTDTLNIPSGTEGVNLSIGTSVASISPLPANLVVAKASFCRLNGAI